MGGVGVARERCSRNVEAGDALVVGEFGDAVDGFGGLVNFRFERRALIGGQRAIGAGDEVAAEIGQGILDVGQARLLDVALVALGGNVAQLLLEIVEIFAESFGSDEAWKFCSNRWSTPWMPVEMLVMVATEGRSQDEPAVVPSERSLDVWSAIAAA